MRRSIPLERMLFFSAVLWTAIFLSHRAVQADPSKYPQFAQQKLADNITPVFVAVDELVKEITAVKKPLIIDVRTEEEYREAHILGAVSSPWLILTLIYKIFPWIGRSFCIELALITWPVWPTAFSMKRVIAI